jgi:predicted ester cyclase
MKKSLENSTPPQRGKERISRSLSPCSLTKDTSIAGLVSAFPDVHRELLNIYVAKNVVVVELAIRGTHKGELTLASGTLAPTGKAIDVPCCDVYHLESGKIISFHCYNQPSVMQQQLGVGLG